MCYRFLLKRLVTTNLLSVGTVSHKWNECWWLWWMCYHIQLKKSHGKGVRHPRHCRLRGTVLYWRPQFPQQACNHQLCVWEHNSLKFHLVQVLSRQSGQYLAVGYRGVGPRSRFLRPSSTMLMHGWQQEPIRWHLTATLSKTERRGTEKWVFPMVKAGWVPHNQRRLKGNS